jgi:hypothetical protein
LYVFPANVDVAACVNVNDVPLTIDATFAPSGKPVATTSCPTFNPAVVIPVIVMLPDVWFPVRIPVSVELNVNVVDVSASFCSPYPSPITRYHSTSGTG